VKSPAAAAARREVRPGRAPEPRTEWAPRIAWLLPVIALVLAVVVQRRALGAFFGTDDFVRLEEAAGLRPATPTVWRLLSEVLYVRFMLGVFGPLPLPFHIVSMTLHLANTGFVYRTGRQAGYPAAAAFFAAVTFGTFPLFYALLPSAVNINDVLALTYVFLALLALENPTPGRIAGGVACFVIALLSKEAVVFVPFAAVLLPRSGERLAGAARRLAPLLATGVVFAGLYLAFRKHGLGTGGEAYAMGFGRNLFHNLMTYARWCVELIHLPGGGALDPHAWRTGIWPLAAFALAATLAPACRAAIGFGVAWWLLGLVPVLPLVAHTYAHYLYVPLAGFALAAAATLDALLAWLEPLVRSERRGAAAVATAAAFVALAFAFAARSEVLIHQRVTPRLGASQFALDPFTRKMEIAVRAVATVAGTLDRSHDSLVVFMPPGFGQAISATTGEKVGSPPPGVPQYDVTEAVLDGGRALRLFEPRIDSVAFVSRWTPAYRNFTLFIEGPGGKMEKMGRGAHAHAKFASTLINGEYRTQARDYLVALVEAFPDDRRVRLLYAVALAQTGDARGAAEQARLVAESAPPDSIGNTARRLVTRMEGAK
jgi:hypothetical protein